jgi:hypothetical protein
MKAAYFRRFFLSIIAFDLIAMSWIAPTSIGMTIKSIDGQDLVEVGTAPWAIAHTVIHKSATGHSPIQHRIHDQIS